MSQAAQLKSFKPPGGKQFVALLVPQKLPPQGCACSAAAWPRRPPACTCFLLCECSATCGCPPAARALRHWGPAAARHPPRSEGEGAAPGGVIPGAAFAQDYHWVREYHGKVRLDDTGTTFVFRFAGDGTVQVRGWGRRGQGIGGGGGAAGRAALPVR